MATGEVHHSKWRSGFLLVPLLVAAAWIITSNLQMSVAVPVGYLLGRYIDPDLDLIGLTGSEGRLMRELGFFGVVVVILYFPYAYLMRFVGIGRRGHRNFFSHFPVVSTAIRLAWLLAIPAAILWRYEISVDPRWLWGLAGVAVGLSLADTIHFIYDAIPQRKRRSYR